MTMPHVLDRLPLWVEGDLNGAEMAEVEDHLHKCPACRKAAEQLQSSQVWLREAMDSPFERSDQERLRSRVMDQVRAESILKPAHRLVARQGLLTACAASLLVAVLVWRRDHRSPAPPAVPEPPKVARNSAPSDPHPLPVHRDAPRVVQLRRQRPHTQRTESTPQDGPARIEFQTADPTIHIIWLAQAKPLSDATRPLPENP
jgi:hypothetical protein